MIKVKRMNISKLSKILLRVDQTTPEIKCRFKLHPQLPLIEAKLLDLIAMF